MTANEVNMVLVGDTFVGRPDPDAVLNRSNILSREQILHSAIWKQSLLIATILISMIETRGLAWTSLR